MIRQTIKFMVKTPALSMMSTQKTLSSFFKPVPKVQKRKDCQPDDNSEPLSKKFQNDSDSKDCVPTTIASPEILKKPESSCLSPEQKERCEQNRTRAKAKMVAKKLSALSSNIGHSWFISLESEFSKEYFQKLSSFLEVERQKFTVFPPVDDVYSWTLTCNVKEVKVVILGQDPYHGVNQAHGLAFSVRKGVAIPPSLLNMYKELSVDIPGFVIPAHGCLQGWAEQGVLLLNAVLTVRSGNANSHKDKGWENLTDAVIRYLNEHLTGVVFLLWGSYAQKKGSFINKKCHLVLNSPHPSPLSAHRGFFGCRHFSKANDYLLKLGKQPIDWKNLPQI